MRCRSNGLVKESYKGKKRTKIVYSIVMRFRVVLAARWCRVCDGYRECDDASLLDTTRPSTYERQRNLRGLTCFFETFSEIPHHHEGVGKSQDQENYGDERC